MAINWVEVQKALSPIKDYEDLCNRYKVSFGYSFVRKHFNFSMPKLLDYTQRLLGGDAKQRYTEYLANLTRIIGDLNQAGIQDILALKERTSSREALDDFVTQTRLDATDIIRVLKFMVYWLIPSEKYLGGLVRNDPEITGAIKVLAEVGVKNNLQLLENGLTPKSRKELAERSGLAIEVIYDLLNRADFSRMPWASKATISNIIGAGYSSMAQLAQADPEKLFDDFFGYGRSIGKNLKLGNEIENSYRVAKIIPALVQEG